MFGRSSHFLEAGAIDGLCDAIEHPIRALLTPNVPAVAA
jgi:hypothetical protein